MNKRRLAQLTSILEQRYDDGLPFETRGESSDSVSVYTAKWVSTAYGFKEAHEADCITTLDADNASALSTYMSLGFTYGASWAFALQLDKYRRIIDYAQNTRANVTQAHKLFGGKNVDGLMEVVAIEMGKIIEILQPLIDADPSDAHEEVGL